VLGTFLAPTTRVFSVARFRKASFTGSRRDGRSPDDGFGIFDNLKPVVGQLVLAVDGLSDPRERPCHFRQDSVPSCFPTETRTETLDRLMAIATRTQLGPQRRIPDGSYSLAISESLRSRIVDAIRIANCPKVALDCGRKRDEGDKSARSRIAIGLEHI
jgi:hypothetical protein